MNLNVAINTQTAADKFMDCGYVLVPCDRHIIDEATSAVQILIKLCREDAAQWALTRTGENEPDVGLIDTREEAGKDHKFFFHYSPDLRFLAGGNHCVISPEMSEAIEVLRTAYGHISFVTLSFAQQLEELYGSEMRPNFVKRMIEARDQPVAYTATTLRGLWYPDAPKQTGAQVHIDRSALTCHCGDQNGQLFGLFGEDNEQQFISPEHGYAVIFAGVRWYWETYGRRYALKHGSTTEPGTDRQALVQFMQTDVGGYKVRSSKEAMKHFEKECEPKKGMHDCFL